MGEDVQLAVADPFAPSVSAGRFDQVSIGLHWLTVFLVAGQFTSAFLLSQTEGGDPAASAALLTLHRSTGLVTWMVVAARLAWRGGFAHLPPFPASMPRLQQLAARLNEYGLYGLLLLQPLTGLGDTVLRGHGYSLFFWRVGALGPANRPLAHALHGVHEFGAWALAALIGLHAAAALLHGLVLRDGVLQRMWPWTRR